jgi:antitoxin ParD1/3/4/toxin ParE1/3/4
MRRFRLTEAARGDLAEIAQYIARDDPEAARRVLRRMREAMHLLAERPAIGHIRPDLAPEPIRFWPVFSYLIVYQPDSRPLQVLRVLHGARDLPRLSDSDPTIAAFGAGGRSQTEAGPGRRLSLKR